MRKTKLLFILMTLAFLIGGVNFVWGATYYRHYKIHVIAVSDDEGEPGKVYAFDGTSSATVEIPENALSSAEYTTATITHSGTSKARAKITGTICYKANPGYSFERWYWEDPTCTDEVEENNPAHGQLLIVSDQGDTRIFFTGNAWGPNISAVTTNDYEDETVGVINFYAKFTKDPPARHYAELQYLNDENKRVAYLTSSGYKYEPAAVLFDTASYANTVLVDDYEIICKPIRGYRFTGWTTTGSYDYPYNAFGADKADAFIRVNANSTDSENPDVVTVQAGYASLSPVTLTLRKLAGRGSVAVSYKNYIDNAAHDGLELKSADMESFASASEEKNYTVYSTDEITMMAIPEEGYSFLGWYSVNATTGEKTLVSGEASYTISLSSNKIYYAYFNKEITAADKFMVGYSICQSLEQALAAVTETDKTIVQLNDYTVPAGNYTIPADVTLLIPYHEGQTVPTVLQRVGDASIPDHAYRTLTLANGANVNVYGTIEVSGCQAAGTVNGGGQEAPGRAGGEAYGQMVMNAGSKITLNSGAKLNTWGYVTGQGEIDVRRGAIVREQFEIRDWKSIRNTTVFWHNGNDAKYGVLPVNQYYIQNVEVPTTYHPGAKLKAMVSLNVQYAGIRGVVAMNDVGIIGVRGTDKAIFLMNEEDDSEDTWVRKSYNPTTDQQVYEANNSAYLGSLVLKIELAALGGIGSWVGDVTMDSRDYVLPITNNFKIHLKSGELHVTQNTVLLPGVIIEVDKKSTLTIDANQTLYLYDTDEWGAYVAGTWNGGDDYTFGYGTRVTNRPGGVPDVRNISTQDGMGDAQLIVHGTVDVKGYLRTTDGGASITSTNADAGTVKFTNAAPSVAYLHVDTVFQVNTITPDYVGAHTVSALLKNETGDAFRETAGTEAGISYCYMNGAWRNMEQVDQCFVKDGTTYFAKPQDYVQLQSGSEDGNHLFHSSDGGRTFIHAFDNDGNCQWWEVEYVADNLYHCLHPLNDKYYYYAGGDWLEKKFKVSWVNWDGSPVNYTNLDDEQVNYYMVSYNTTPQWLSANPTRANDASHEYSFAGWMPDLAPVTADVTYMAKYQERDRMYSITFNDESGELIQLLYCKLGEIPVCDKYDAAANGKEWKTVDGEQPIGAVSKNEVYKLFTKDVVGPFTIRFVNWNGEELQSGSVEKDARPVYNGTTPSKPADNSHAYTFVGWTPSIASATQNMTYTAKFETQQHIGLNVVNVQTISSNLTIQDVRVSTTGSLNVTGSITANNFYLESNGSSASGQIVGGEGNITADHIYFDYKVNAKNHKWYGVAVPWQVDATSGISVNGKTLVLGKDFDIIYYNGAQRAEVGKQKCWTYVAAGEVLQPGRLYMIGLMMDAQTIRFEKKSGASILKTTTSVTAWSGGAASDDQGWNGVANPALFHAFVNPGVTAGQVYNPKTNSYDPILMNDAKFVVGQGAFVEVSSNKAITVTYGGAYAAPRRARAEEAPLYDVRIAPAEAEYTDRLFVRVEDEKEADKYVIGKDLEKLGVSKSVAQMWINRYNTELCLNTMTMENGAAEYPLGIFAPHAGEYMIYINSAHAEYDMYLTFNGEAIWNLSDAAYTGTFDAGTTSAYGLRISARAPQITTGIDEAVVDAKGETRKVLIDNQVFIIRGENVYTIDGQLVK